MTQEEWARRDELEGLRSGDIAWHIPKTTFCVVRRTSSASEAQLPITDACEHNRPSEAATLEYVPLFVVGSACKISSGNQEIADLEEDSIAHGPARLRKIWARRKSDRPTKVSAEWHNYKESACRKSIEKWATCLNTYLSEGVKRTLLSRVSASRDNLGAFE